MSIENNKISNPPLVYRKNYLLIDPCLMKTTITYYSGFFFVFTLKKEKTEEKDGNFLRFVYMESKEKYWEINIGASVDYQSE